MSLLNGAGGQPDVFPTLAGTFRRFPLSLGAAPGAHLVPAPGAFGAPLSPSLPPSIRPSGRPRVPPCAVAARTAAALLCAGSAPRTLFEAAARLSGPAEPRVIHGFSSSSSFFPLFLLQFLTNSSPTTAV